MNKSLSFFFLMLCILLPSTQIMLPHFEGGEEEVPLEMSETLPDTIEQQNELSDEQKAHIANRMVTTDASPEGKIANTIYQITALHDRLMKNPSVTILPEDREAIANVTRRWNDISDSNKKLESIKTTPIDDRTRQEVNETLANSERLFATTTKKTIDQKLADLQQLLETANKNIDIPDTAPGLLTRLINWLQEKWNSLFTKEEDPIITQLQELSQLPRPLTKKDTGQITLMLTTLVQKELKEQSSNFIQQDTFNNSEVLASFKNKLNAIHPIAINQILNMLQEKLGSHYTTLIEETKTITQNIVHDMNQQIEKLQAVLDDTNVSIDTKNKAIKTYQAALKTLLNLP